MRVGLRCDASARSGVGHLMRCLALGEALEAAGHDVVVLGAIDVGWARAMVARPVVAGAADPTGLVEQAGKLRLDAVVLDSYTLDPACAGALRSAGVRTLAIVDGDPRGQQADLYLDQNLGAELTEPALPPGAVRLAGLRYALLRTAVTGRRPAAPRPPRDAVPRVLCFFGGTDAAGAAPMVVRLLDAIGAALDATIVAPIIAPVGIVAPSGSALRLRLVEPGAQLPALIGEADLVISAAGSSTWELFCLGVPTALLCVADNQRSAYRHTLAAGLAVGLGDLQDLTTALPPTSVRRLREVVRSPALRAELSARGWAAVDGGGAARVADALAASVGLGELTAP